MRGSPFNQEQAVVKPSRFMFIAGEASGDILGAELIVALRERLGARDAQFFGVGGAQMQAAGMELIFDFARNAVFGLEAFTRLWEFRKRFNYLLEVAMQRRPDAIICVDFAGFNRRFARAVKEHVRRNAFSEWSPKIIQYVSPQVWASRPGRADKLAKDVDLLLSIFPFEKAWYARRTPNLRVEFVGHPMVDRYKGQVQSVESSKTASPTIVFLPGSRPSELKRHLPVMCEAMKRIRADLPKVRAVMVLSDRLTEMARRLGLPADFEMRSNLADALAQADLAIAKSGTVTLECAFFRVPTVAMYKTSMLTYAIAKRIVKVKWIAMPNILANEEVFPEFVQSDATADNITGAALELLRDTARRNTVKAKLGAVAASLGEPGAAHRAAEEILGLLKPASAIQSVRPSGE
jgi:lipid-A-disaccharide synthase